MPLRFPPPATETAQLALDTILHKPATGIPAWLLNVMEHRHIERIAGAPPGAYRQDPDGVYIAMQQRLGTCLLDQYLATNPLTMGDAGYERDAERRGSATSGVGSIVCDGMLIDSPESVVEHMEQFVFPRLQQSMAVFDEDSRVRGDT